MEHIPVMLGQVLELLDGVNHDAGIVDATLGLGGYSEAILQMFPRAVILGVDRDPEAIRRASDRLRSYGDRFRPVLGNFGQLDDLLAREGWNRPCAVIFDLGVSNMQISVPERGFSFQEDGPLDMRMDEGAIDAEAPTAADIVNTSTVGELAGIFRTYGEERNAMRIARVVVSFRENNGPFSTTGELVSAIRKGLPAPLQRKMGRNPARKVFQALRIVVNGELESLRKGLNACERVASGREMLVVAVSYHSLEDRIVKQMFREWGDRNSGSVVFRKPRVPEEQEIEANRKARSAKMRAFRFTDQSEVSCS